MTRMIVVKPSSAWIGADCPPGYWTIVDTKTGHDFYGVLDFGSKQDAEKYLKANMEALIAQSEAAQ